MLIINNNNVSLFFALSCLIIEIDLVKFNSMYCSSNVILHRLGTLI